MLADLESTSPPTSFAAFHDSLVKTVRGLRVWLNYFEAYHDPSSKHYKSDVRSTTLGYYDTPTEGEAFAANLSSIATNADLLVQEDAKLRVLVTHRTPTASRNRTLKVEFQPKGLPILFDKSNGVLHVSCSLDTPIGNFTVSQAEHPGIKKLIIIKDGMRKYLNISGYNLSMPIPASRLTVQGETMTLDADAFASNGR